MPQGPFGVNRPLTKSKITLVVLTENKVELDGFMIQEINNNMRNPSIGPGWDADTIESIDEDRGITETLFSPYNSELNPLNQGSVGPTDVPDQNGIMMTIGFPTISPDDIQRIINSVDREINTTGQWLVGCI